MSPKHILGINIDDPFHIGDEHVTCVIRLLQYEFEGSLVLASIGLSEWGPAGCLEEGGFYPPHKWAIDEQLIRSTGGRLDVETVRTIQARFDELVDTPKDVIKSRYDEYVERQRERYDSEYNAPFDTRKNAADYNYWLGFPVWTPREALLLAAGLDPRKVTAQHLSSRTRHPFVRKLNDDWAKMSRAIKQGVIEHQPTPARFVTWAQESGVEIHPDLKSAVTETGLLRGNGPDGQSHPTEPDVSEAELIEAGEEFMALRKSGEIGRGGLRDWFEPFVRRKFPNRQINDDLLRKIHKQVVPREYRKPGR